MFQGRIYIEKGIITKLTPLEGFVEIRSESGTERFDGWAMPGFVDSHGHLSSLGAKLNGLDLSSAESMEEIISLCKDFERRNGWIIGRGWNQELFFISELPDRTALDAAFPNEPVYLTRIDGHCALANGKALELASISKNTANPDGGEIYKDKNGEPSGILIDNAMNLIRNILPRRTGDKLEKDLLSSCIELAARGITECCEMETDSVLFKALKKLDDEQKLPIKVNSFLPAHDDDWMRFCPEPYFGKKFKAIGLKFFADGALGSRGAALKEPYADMPDNSGLMLISKHETIEKASKGIERGFHIATHVIGDLAAEKVISAFETLRNGYSSAVLRLEHLQLVSDEDIARIAQLGIIASVQPVHCISDAVGMAQSRLGGRCSYSYPWKKLIDKGITLVSGSDFPIESHDPLVGIYALVGRIPFNSVKSWFPGERVSIVNAIESYTSSARYALRGENNKAGLETGSIADIVVLDTDIVAHDNNILSVKLEKIKNCKAIACYCDGKRV